MNSENLQVLIASEKDLAELVTLVNSAYRGESARAGWTNESSILSGERITTSLLREEMHSPGRTFLCLRDGVSQTLVGCVSLELHEEECHLGMLTVRPTLQNQSLGKFMMAEAESFARKAGAKRMMLSVIHLRAELLAWYLRRGYRKTGETEPFPADTERFPRLTQEPLHFVLMEKTL